MLSDRPSRPATFAAVFVALTVAHDVADHWVQTQYQADTKGCPGTAGRIACAAHVATYTATALAAVTTVQRLTGAQTSPGRVAAGLAVSAVSHYVADRRTPLRKLAERVGAGQFYALGTPRPGRDDNPSLGTGAYALDQSFHRFFLLAAALVMSRSEARYGIPAR